MKIKLSIKPASAKIATIVIFVGLIAGALTQGSLSQQESSLPKTEQLQQNSQPCPDDICDNYEKSIGTWSQDRDGTSDSQSQQNQSPQFQQPPRLDKFFVKITGAKYKTVSTKPTAGWFKTGQNADITLSSVDFNNAGGPLLFNHPGAVASDGAHLLLADRNNNRILIWNKLPTSNIPPDLVLGQKDFISNNPGTGLDQLNWPVSITASNGKVVVADTNNHRILIWNTFPMKNGQAADLEITDGRGSPKRDVPPLMAGLKKGGAPLSVCAS